MGTLTAELYNSVRLTANGRDFNAPIQVGGSGGFGDLVVANLTTRVQKDFVYGNDSEALVELEGGNGVITYADGMAHCSSGGVGVARLTSKAVVKYRAGQVAVFRFTSLFGATDAACELLVGAFSCSTNALVVGMDGTSLGFLRRHSGAVEVQALQITTASAGAETVTITLNGVTVDVSTTAGTVEDTAEEIAGGTYPDWTAEAVGDEVHFLSAMAGAKAGTYAISSTGAAAGTYTQEWAGAAATDEWHHAVGGDNPWNLDPLDGSGPSGMTIDPLKLNVWQVTLAYLGGGPIVLSVLDGLGTSGRWVDVLRIPYPNKHVIPNVTNPTFHLGLCASSTLTSCSVATASVAGFIGGDNALLGYPHASTTDGIATGAGAVTPVLTVRNSNIFHSGASRTNLRDVVLQKLSVAAMGSNKPVRFTLVLNGTLTDANFVAYDSGQSIVDVDKSATGITGGTVLMGVNRDAIEDVDNITLAPGDMISVVITPVGTAADYDAVLSWLEDL